MNVKSEEEEAAEAAAIEAQEHQIDSSSLEKPLEWLDVTQFLRDTTQTMTGGQMIHSVGFSLFRSMSAVEIGDPKMDPGLYHEKILTVYQAVEKGVLPVNPSTLQVLSVMDDLMGCETAWFSGDPLSTSLLTCLYLHDPKVVRHPILKAYLNIVIKCCNEARSTILNADIFEEEDFIPHAYSFAFGDDISFDDALNEVKRIEAELDQQVRLSKQASKSSNSSGDESGASSNSVSIGAGDEKAASNGVPTDQHLYEALLCRFRFRKALVQLHANLRKPACRGVHSAEKLISRALIELQLIEDSMALTESISAPGFDKLSTRNLVPHAPPRQVRVRTRAQGIAYHRSVLNHLSKILILPQLKTYEEVLSFVLSFSALQRPGIVVRSHLLLLLGGEESFVGKAPLCDWLQQSFLQFCEASKFSIQTDLWKWFIDRVSKPTWQFLRVYSANRPRQRRRIGKLLHDLAILQDDSAALDQRAAYLMLNAGYNMSDPKAPTPCRHACFTWVFESTLTALIHYLFLGFELELHSPREFPMLYWYLEYLHDVRLANFSLAATRTPSLESKKGNPKKKDKKAATSAPVATFSFVLVEAYRHLCLGVLRTVQLLIKKDALVLRPFDLGSESLVFQHRFAQLLKVNQPNHLSFEEFVAHNDVARMDPALLVNAALAAFKTAKEKVEHATKLCSPPTVILVDDMLVSLRGLLKVCIANTVAVLGLDKALQKGRGKVRVDFAYSAHPLFPIITISQ